VEGLVVSRTLDEELGLVTALTVDRAVVPVSES